MGNPLLRQKRVPHPPPKNHLAETADGGPRVKSSFRLQLPGVSLIMMKKGGEGMRVCGIIAEYDPFHQGHAYHLAQARARTEADAVVCVISGSFTQRGLPALLPAHARAEMALRCGADVVVHSATKFIGGHGTSLGGVIVEGGRFDWAAAGRFPALSAPNPSYHGVSFTQAAGPAALVTYIRAVLLRDTGAAISPFNAFLLLQGLETLSLRVERHVENALRVVDFLVNHPKVERVNHPSLPENGYRPLYEKYFPRGGGSIFTFEIKGGAAEAQAFIDKLRIFSLLANVADVKSLAIHPASTTHSQMTPEELAQSGIRPNTIRLSIGTEHIDDILADLAAALEA